MWRHVTKHSLPGEIWRQLYRDRLFFVGLHVWKFPFETDLGLFVVFITITSPLRTSCNISRSIFVLVWPIQYLCAHVECETFVAHGQLDASAAHGNCLCKISCQLYITTCINILLEQHTWMAPNCYTLTIVTLSTEDEELFSIAEIESAKIKCLRAYH